MKPVLVKISLGVLLFSVLPLTDGALRQTGRTSLPKPLVIQTAVASAPPADGRPATSPSPKPQEIAPLSTKPVTADTGTTGPLPPAVAASVPDAAPDYPVKRYRALGAVPTDPRLPDQDFLAKIGAPAAWATTTGTPDQIVAVIDTGYALANTDLASKWQLNAGEMGAATTEGAAPNCTSRGLALDKSCNNLDNDGDDYASNWRGWSFTAGNNNPQAGLTNSRSAAAYHGTLVASLIGAAANTTAGVGINPSTQIMPLQALDDNGDGDTTTIADAISYAVDHGASVINLSLGGTEPDDYLRAHIAYAVSQGVAVVAAAGNDGCDCLSYPAAYPEVVAVGATDAADTLATFSSYGTNLDLVAPGTDICGSSWSRTNQTTAFTCGSGTSFAAPLVSGAISLLVSTGLSPEQARQIIVLSSQRIAGLSGHVRNNQYGFGRLDLAAAFMTANTPAATRSTTTITRVFCANSATTCTARLIDADGHFTELMNAKQGSTDYYYFSTDEVKSMMNMLVPVSNQNQSFGSGFIRLIP